MTRRPLIAGNWKMHTTVSEGAGLVMKLRDLVKDAVDADVVVAPPFTSIHHIHFLVAESRIRIAAQDIHWEKSGAFTGEVSAAMAKDAGCEYAIIGHSERRQFFGETDATVNKKAAAALIEGLRPIVCVGETLKERDEGKTLEVVRRQVREGLSGIGPGAGKDLAVAYEPVWAIGTGKTASPAEAEEVHAAIRELLYEMLGRQGADPVRIIYGGSVKPSNIDTLMAEPNIDGALVGGASLAAEDFARIVNFRKNKA